MTASGDPLLDRERALVILHEEMGARELFKRSPEAEMEDFMAMLAAATEGLVPFSTNEQKFRSIMEEKIIIWMHLSDNRLLLIRLLKKLFMEPKK